MFGMVNYKWMAVRLMLLVAVFGMLAGVGKPLTVRAQSEPGGNNHEMPLTDVKLGSIIPLVKQSGQISVSVDGLGTNQSSGIIQVDKPAGAKVISAYMAAATTGFSGRRLANNDVTIDGTGVTWNITTPSSISSYNSWAEVRLCLTVVILPSD